VETGSDAHLPKSDNTEIAESTEDTEKNQVGFPKGVVAHTLVSLFSSSAPCVPSVLKDFWRAMTCDNFARSTYIASRCRNKPITPALTHEIRE